MGRYAVDNLNLPSEAMIRDVWFEVAMKLVAVILVAVPGMLSSRMFPVFHAVRTSVKAACIRPGRCGLGFPWEVQIQNLASSPLLPANVLRGGHLSSGISPYEC